jgi:muramoyltetrapeptide carboxypeptidase
VAGQFTDCPEHCDDDGRRTLAEVIGEVAAALDVPAVLDVPVGHVDDQWTLPLGAPAVLEAGETVALRVTWPAAAGPTT